MKKSKNKIDPEDLLKDADNLFSLLKEIEEKDERFLDADAILAKAKKIEKKIKEKYPDYLDIKE